LNITNIIITGVGGQGLVLATNIISSAAFYEGYDIKTSDVIGLSQRGGMVWGLVRFGKAVPSPLVPNGQGDILVAMERLEGLRWTHLLKDNATVILSDETIFPNRVLLEKEEYPEAIGERLLSKGYTVEYVDAKRISKEIGNTKVSNTILIGKLSKRLPFSPETWYRVIKENVPQKSVDINIEAFNRGREL
jgi:indolepyruvate ferredoxin oxidoreductase, beta subunit